MGTAGFPTVVLQEKKARMSGTRLCCLRLERRVFPPHPSSSTDVCIFIRHAWPEARMEILAQAYTPNVVVSKQPYEHGVFPFRGLWLRCSCYSVTWHPKKDTRPGCDLLFSTCSLARNPASTRWATGAVQLRACMSLSEPAWQHLM